MKYIGLLTSAASGKLGGVVASHNRNGSYLRRHAIPVQPRTALQTKYRSQLAALSSQFKNLSAIQVTQWNAMAATIVLKSKLGTTYNPTGQQLFVSCNKHLQSVGITAILQNPTNAPTFPSITTFTAAPAYTGGFVSDWTLTTTPNPNTAFYLSIRATAGTTTGRSFVGKSAFRTLGYTNSGTGTVVVSNDFLGKTQTNVLAAWLEMFGGMAVAGNVNFELRYIDPVSGFASSPVRAATTFSQLGFTISVNNTLLTGKALTTQTFNVNLSNAPVGNFSTIPTYAVGVNPLVTPANTPTAFPTGLTATIPAFSSIPGTTTVTLNVANTLVAGTYSVLVVAKAGGVLATQTITLVLS